MFKIELLLLLVFCFDFVMFNILLNKLPVRVYISIIDFVDSNDGGNDAGNVVCNDGGNDGGNDDGNDGGNDGGNDFNRVVLVIFCS